MSNYWTILEYYVLSFLWLLNIFLSLQISCNKWILPSIFISIFAKSILTY